MEKEEPKQELPQLGTKEFNELASAYFGGKPKQETLEEAAERLYPEEWYWIEKKVFQEAAKWQQEKMYSEVEVLTLLQKLAHDVSINQWNSFEKVNTWFEQFKKK